MDGVMTSRTWVSAGDDDLHDAERLAEVAASDHLHVVLATRLKVPNHRQLVA